MVGTGRCDSSAFRLESSNTASDAADEPPWPWRNDFISADATVALDIVLRNGLAERGAGGMGDGDDVADGDEGPPVSSKEFSRVCGADAFIPVVPSAL